MRVILRILFIFTTLSGCATASHETSHLSTVGGSSSFHEAMESVPRLVSDQYVLEKNRFYKKLTVDASHEEDKIMYLIEELRQSPYSFERNGEVHKSTRAAQHLMMKYYRAKDRISTAEDFIKMVATKSNKTGREYQVIFDERHKYPSNVVLRSELAKLNELLHAKGVF